NAKKSITHVEIQAHLEHLLDLNPQKKVVVFMDNAPTHKSAKIQEFYQKNKDILEVILLPRYSPYMNPQENVWHYLKEKLFRPSDRGSIVELIQDTEALFIELNSRPGKIHSFAYARSFLI
ncbi:MAG: transposase, partial [Clostridia bacterium]